LAQGGMRDGAAAILHFTDVGGERAVLLLRFHAAVRRVGDLEGTRAMRGCAVRMFPNALGGVLGVGGTSGAATVCQCRGHDAGRSGAYDNVDEQQVLG
jgi:hypothetical protein